MQEKYNKAFSEVIEVINHSSKEVVEKIPNRFICFLEENRDMNYIVNIDFNSADWEKKIKSETRTILALIYRDYLVSKEERNLLIEEEEKIKEEFEKQLREKYNPDNVFRKHNVDNNVKESLTKEQVDLVEYKESIFKKIINKIKVYLNLI